MFTALMMPLVRVAMVLLSQTMFGSDTVSKGFYFCAVWVAKEEPCLLEAFCRSFKPAVYLKQVWQIVFTLSESSA
jgi:hypothetical protein